MALINVSQICCKCQNVWLDWPKWPIESENVFHIIFDSRFLLPQRCSFLAVIPFIKGLMTWTWYWKHEQDLLGLRCKWKLQQLFSTVTECYHDFSILRYWTLPRHNVSSVIMLPFPNSNVLHSCGLSTIAFFTNSGVQRKVVFKSSLGVS